MQKEAPSGLWPNQDGLTHKSHGRTVASEAQLDSLGSKHENIRVYCCFARWRRPCHECCLRWLAALWGFWPKTDKSLWLNIKACLNLAPSGSVKLLEYAHSNLSGCLTPAVASTLSFVSSDRSSLWFYASVEKDSESVSDFSHGCGYPLRAAAESLMGLSSVKIVSTHIFLWISPHSPHISINKCILS